MPPPRPPSPSASVQDDADDSYDFENDYTVSYVFEHTEDEETAEEFCNLVSEGDPLTYAKAITINEERIIVFYGRAIPAICVTQNATQLESQKGASKHSH